LDVSSAVAIRSEELAFWFGRECFTEFGEGLNYPYELSLKHKISNQIYFIIKYI
jgi:hypothetical protein